MNDKFLHGRQSHDEWQLLIEQLSSNNIDRLILDYVSYHDYGETLNLPKVSLADALKSNSSLSELTLKGCSLDDKLGQIIISILNHPKITSLTVRNYGESIPGELGPPFVSALSSLLYFNNKLNSLALEHLHPTIDITLICSAIASSKSLETIHFRYMKFSPANQDKILLAITENRSLKEIKCENCEPEFTAKILKILDKRELKDEVIIALLQNYLKNEQYWRQFVRGLLNRNAFPNGIRDMQQCCGDLEAMKKIVSREAQVPPGFFGRTQEHEQTLGFYQQVKQAQDLRDLVIWLKAQNYQHAGSLVYGKGLN